MKFSYAELFAGIGGFSFGLKEIGGECVMASEWDKFAKQSYQILHPEVNLQDDVTKIDAEEVPEHDVLVFGMPCQAFSAAGKGLGFEDMRGTLYFEAMRIAKEKKPKILWMENVKGLVSHDKGRTLDVMVQAMNDVGYTVDFEVLNSKYFGVPQNRERIFLIGVRNGLVETAEWEIGKRKDVVAKGKQRIAQLGVNTFNFDWPTQESVSVRLRDILESEVDEKYYLSEEKTANLVAQLEEREQIKGEPPLPLNLVSRGAEGGSEPQMLGHIDLKGHDAIKRVYSAEGVSPTLTTMGGGHREPKIAECKQGYRIRKLTPLECWRLQGFPDDVHEAVKSAGISDSQRYKQAGNAVTVNVISAIGRRLLSYL